MTLYELHEIRAAEPVPFDSVPECPACCGTSFTLRYHGMNCVSGIGHGWIETHQFGEPEAPHIHLTCVRCDFWFVSKVARP